MDPLNVEFVRLQKASGWTQSKAAEKLHIDRVSVYRYMAGTVRPRLTTLQLFAELIGEKINVADSGPPAESKAVIAQRGSRRTIEWEEEALEALRKLPARERNMLILALGRIGSRIHPEVEEFVDVTLSDPHGRTGQRAQPAPPPPMKTERDPAGITKDSPLANQKISNQDSLPGVSPRVAEAARASGPAAVRLALEADRRQRAKLRPSSSTAASTGREHPPTGRTDPHSSRHSATPAPAPDEP